MPEDFVVQFHRVPNLDPKSERTRHTKPLSRCTGEKLRAQLRRLPAESLSCRLLLCGRHQHGQLPASRHRRRSPGNRSEEHHSGLRSQSSCAHTQYDIHSRTVHRCVSAERGRSLDWLLARIGMSLVCLVFPLWSKSHVDSKLPWGVNVSMCWSRRVRPALSSDGWRREVAAGFRTSATCTVIIMRR